MKDAPDRPGLAVLLGGIAGSVDAIGYLLLAHLFTAHMTGNSVAMSVRFATRDWGEALRRAWPIFFFIVGGIVGATLGELGERAGVRRPLTLLLALEGTLLVFLMAIAFWVPHPPADGRFVLITGLAATAMGIQNVAFRHFGSPSLNTTVVTGALTSACEHFVTFAFWLRAHARTCAWGELLRESRRHPDRQRGALSLSIWLAYIAGAALGAAGQANIGSIAVLVPVAGVAIAIGMDRSV